jgi:hypothetical protein
LNSHVLSQVPFEVRDPIRLGFLWRTVVAQVAVSNGQMLTVCSFHGRPRAGPPPAELQRAFHAGIAGWLATVPDTALFGIDAGPPVLADADPLVGPDPAHGLVEVLRTTDDHLWATRDLEVLDVQCLSDQAAAAGSDHVLLLADLELRAS